MIGVILAAGCGRRLGRDIDLEKIGPKCLLTIDNCTLLERIVSDLVSSDVDAVTIVIGYKADMVRKACTTLERTYGVRLNLVRNGDYLSTNTAYSLNIGLSGIHDDVVIFNGDVLYDRAILDNLLKIDQTAIVVDNTKPLTEESFKVKIVNGRIEEMGKTVPIVNATGEFIGISKIAGRDIGEAKRLLNALVSGDPNNYYDFIYQSLSESGNLAYSFTNGLKWTEIDDIRDLRYAESIAGIAAGARGRF
ncbi:MULTISPECIES: NTP transferase domain-containing protein [Methanoculleus]|uniref:Phosphocholine cytidylyltransferase family protein n=1 Tax=Methanoculleus methanifontis TaxID=2584086 RepID=A0ABT8M4Q1_9EURY|nr:MULTISPECIES: phosphocholine cytidylyltransferase family protein [unclassified Methanoculleus]MDN7013588.1 phosphocholine cytidylyltransferase family protein [Methanoculleus sp. FWC-SCC3]